MVLLQKLSWQKKLLMGAFQKLRFNDRLLSRPKLFQSTKAIRFSTTALCAITGRSKGYLRLYQMSRLKVKKLAESGKLPGTARASW